MNTINYQESIVIPTLQRKLQDLQNSNLILEISLLVEQAKIKDFEQHVKFNQDVIEQKDDEIDLLKTNLENNQNDKNQQSQNHATEVNNLRSQKDNEINLLRDELNNLRSQKDNEINSSKTELNNLINEKQNEINKLNFQLNNFQSEKTNIETQLRREISVKESVLSEYNSLKEKHDALQIQIDELKNKPVTKKKKEEVLVNAKIN